ncbi:MAG TPA: hypothetical protein VGN38_13495 [Caulobacteraceae bacterium]|jgi:outer membrane lipoprotein SlyB|nr:hypothetical protein [Caulobacteraceae bacterium]
MKIVAYAATLAVALAGFSGPANAVGCLSGAVAGGVAGHFVRTGPAHHRHTLTGAAAGCVAGHMMKMHQKKVARERAAAQMQAAHPH